MIKKADRGNLLLGGLCALSFSSLCCTRNILVTNKEYPDCHKLSPEWRDCVEIPIAQGTGSSPTMSVVVHEGQSDGVGLCHRLKCTIKWFLCTLLLWLNPKLNIWNFALYLAFLFIFANKHNIFDMLKHTLRLPISNFYVR